MAGGPIEAASPYGIGERVGALAMVVLLSAFVGMLVGLLAGYHIPRIGRFPGYHLKPLIKVVKIPPIIGMIVMGCIVRNFFGDSVKPYPAFWAQWLRSCCLAILLVRGGLQVSFRGKGILVLLLTFIPQIIECTTIALIGYGLFEMPMEVCFAMGYAVASVAPAIVVPQLMRLNEQGYGRSKGIAGSLIAACTFDNIVCLICFGICKTILIEYAERARGNSSQDMGLSIGMLFIHNIAGLVVGVIIGLAAWLFKFILHWKYCMYMKAAYCVIWGVVFIIVGEFSTFTNSKYIACLSLGYTCFRVWGDHKPAKEIAQLWFYIQPCLFGTIGAALLFSQIRPSDVGKSCACIFTGIILRVVSVIVMSHSAKYNIKERIFMGMSWVPKSTVPATLAGVIYTEYKGKAGYSEYEQYGLYIQTTAILSIIFCEPIGSWMIDQFGPKLLSIEKELPVQDDKKDKAELHHVVLPMENEKHHKNNDELAGLNDNADDLQAKTNNGNNERLQSSDSIIMSAPREREDEIEIEKI